MYSPDLYGHMAMYTTLYTVLDLRPRLDLLLADTKPRRIARVSQNLDARLPTDDKLKSAG